MVCWKMQLFYIVVNFFFPSYILHYSSIFYIFLLYYHVTAMKLKLWMVSWRIEHLKFSFKFFLISISLLLPWPMLWALVSQGFWRGIALAFSRHPHIIFILHIFLSAGCLLYIVLFPSPLFFYFCDVILIWFIYYSYMMMILYPSISRIIVAVAYCGMVQFISFYYSGSGSRNYCENSELCKYIIWRCFTEPW